MILACVNHSCGGCLQVMIRYFHQPFYINWNVTIRKNFLSSLGLFLFIDSWIRISFYGLKFITIIICYFTQNVPDLTIGVSSSWLLGPFDTAPSFFWAYLYFLALQMFQAQVLFCSSLELIISPKIPISFYWR